MCSFQISLLRYLLQMPRAMDRITWKLFNSSIIIKQSSICIRYAFSANTLISMASYQKDDIENLLWPLGVGLWPYLEGREDKRMESLNVIIEG